MQFLRNIKLKIINRKKTVHYPMFAIITISITSISMSSIKNFEFKLSQFDFNPGDIR